MSTSLRAVGGAPEMAPFAFLCERVFSFPNRGQRSAVEQMVLSSGRRLPISPGGTVPQSVITDIAWIGRTASPDGPVMQAIGVPTAAALWMGWISVARAVERFELGRRAQNSQRMGDAGLDGVRGVSQSLGGGCSCVHRGTMIAAQITGIDTTAQATTALGKVAYFSGLVGGICFGALYAILIVCGASRLARDLQWKRGLEGKEGSELLAYLADLIKGDQEELTPDEWKKVALEVLVQEFLKWQKIHGGNLTREEASVRIEEIFQEVDKELQEAGVENFLSSFGKGVLESRALENRRMRFSDVLGEKALICLEKGLSSGLHIRLESSDPVVRKMAQEEVEALQKLIDESLAKKGKLDGITLAVGIGGLVLSILSLTLAHPLAVVLVFCALAMCMIYIDGFLGKDHLSQGVPGAYDIPFAIGSGVLIVAAFALGVGLTIAFGLPLFPLIGSGLVMTSSVGVCGFSCHKLKEKRDKWKKEHPELEEVLQEIPHLKEKEEIVALVKKLPREIKEKFRAQFFAEEGMLTFLGLTPWVLFSGEKGEKELLCCAAKKAVKRCWAKVDTLGVDRVLLMQKLFDRVRQEEGGQYSYIHALRDVQNDPELAEILRKETWYVCNRAEHWKSV